MSATPHKILLVDDEQRVLRALARRLMTLQPDWEVVCATSGPEALELMKDAPFDLVVSDLQMPLMDGGVFLSKVRDLYPQTVRFALSGHAQQKLMLKAISLAHQYFSKPCDSNLLADSIASALEDAVEMDQVQIRDMVVRLNQFAPIPEVYNELEAHLKQENCSVSDISAVIIKDPAITAKVLQVANSSFFGASQSIGVLDDAVALLGMDAIRSLVLVFNLMPKPDTNSCVYEISQRIWKHSMNVSGIAVELAKQFFPDDNIVPAVRTASILHDLGIWLLADAHQERYRNAIDRSRANDIPLWFAEKEEFGVSHPQVAAMLFRLWGLPEELNEVIQWHHQPSLSSKANAKVLASVHVADVLDYVSSNNNLACLDRLDKDFLSSLSLPVEHKQWEEWMLRALSD